MSMVVSSGKDEQKDNVMRSPSWLFCRALERLLGVRLSAEQMQRIYVFLGEFEEAQFAIFGRNKSREVRQ